MVLILEVTEASRQNKLLKLFSNDITVLNSLIYFNVKNTKNKINSNFIAKKSEQNTMHFVGTQGWYTTFFCSMQE